MRNSFNTASFSEVVHEVRRDAAEGLFRYVGMARYSSARGLTARIGPAMLGSVKSARRFGYDVRDPFTAFTESSADEPTPIDLALTGIGSCSLTTFLGGGSAKGFVFDSIEVTASCGQRAETFERSETSPVRLDFEVGGDISDEQIAELIQRVQQRSPNYATLAASVPINWTLSTGAGQSTLSTGAGQSTLSTGAGHFTRPDQPTVPRVQPGTRRHHWISGPQIESFSPSSSNVNRLRVDNPKQLTGVDWGPNPQEYLLMGLAAEVAALLAARSRERLGRDVVCEATARCTEDVSGLLRADPSAVVQLQEVSCDVSISPDRPGMDRRMIEELVDEAVSASCIGWLISHPQVVEITSRHTFSS